MPRTEEELRRNRWKKQNTIGEPRLSECVELYNSLGYEVLVEPVDLTGMSAECRRCYREDKTVRTIYTRKKQS